MQLNSASAEPLQLVHLVPQPPEGEALIIPPGVINVVGEPVVNMHPNIEMMGCYSSGLHNSKHSLYSDILIILIVILAHLALFWFLYHMPNKPHSASAQQGKKVYQVSFIPDSGAKSHDHRRLAPHESAARPPASTSAMVSNASSPQSRTVSTVRHAAQSVQHSSKVHTRKVSLKNKGAHRTERPIARRSLSRQHVHGRQPHHMPSHVSRDRPVSREGGIRRSTAQRLPSAQQLIQQVVSSATSNGWQEAAQRFAQEPSTNSQRNAIDRYIADFTRAVQTYIDMNLGTEHVTNAQMMLYITVSRSGHLLQVVISKSTGDGHLDRLAVRTLHQAGPYRPFDPAMGNIPQLSFSRGWLFGEGSAFRFQ